MCNVTGNRGAEPLPPAATLFLPAIGSKVTKATIPGPRYAGNLSRQPRLPSLSPCTGSACMVGEFLLLRNPLAVPTQPQHVLSTESGLSSLVMGGGGKTKPARKKTSARKPASELAREEASTGEPASV